jgi:two-component system response regulator LytT
MRHIVICDDEEVIRSQLRSYLDRLSELTGEHFRVTCLSSGEELLSKLPPDTDILLLDIQMGPISGMDAARDLYRRCRRLCVIFITSQTQYAVEGYGVHAFGFLCKPVQFALFRRQITDALAALSAQEGTPVVLRSRGELYRLSSSEIYYIEARGHAVILASQSGKQEYAVDLIALERQLEGHGFFLCHRGILVNLRQIRKIAQTELVMNNGDVLPLSRQRRKEFLTAFSQQAGGNL